ncbi:MAG: SGNH/GDSL hydrolase family protein [Chloroflexaceae bacterium]|nr:SGNH/GDSL hydrolase family protein [Chloroflexaceae bacterium]
MKQLRFVIGLMLVLLLAGELAVQAAVPSADRSPGDTYLALGDSLATGTNGQGTPTTPYPQRLHQRLTAQFPELTLRSLAKDGETTTSLLSGGQLAEAEAFIASERAAGRRVGLVTLGIGGNDMVSILLQGADPQTTLNSFTANIGMILDRLLAAVTVNGERQADLLLLDSYNPYPGLVVPGRGNLADIWIPQFNAALRQAAAERNLPVANVFQTFTGRESALIFVQPQLCQQFQNITVTCDYHPTNEGQQVLADELYNVSGYSPRRFVFLPLVAQ